MRVVTPGGTSAISDGDEVHYLSTAIRDADTTTALWTYQARALDSGGHTLLSSNSVTATWTQPVVSLAASTTKVKAGQPVTLTARTNQNLFGTPYLLVIRNLTSGKVIKLCVFGTTCVVKPALAKGTAQFDAVEVSIRGAVIAAGPKVTVTWS